MFFASLKATAPSNLLKVSSADEITLVDTVHGTYRDALAASCADGVVDGCEIVRDGDSAAGTGLLTLHTADTAVGAILAHGCALVVVGALYNDTAGVIDEVDVLES